VLARTPKPIDTTDLRHIEDLWGNGEQLKRRCLVCRDDNERVAARYGGRAGATTSSERNEQSELKNGCTTTEGMGGGTAQVDVRYTYRAYHAKQLAQIACQGLDPTGLGTNHDTEAATSFSRFKPP
jgi:hypothetical protein